MVSAQYRRRFMGGSIRQTSGLASATASILALAIAPPPALSHAIESTLVHLSDLQGDWDEEGGPALQLSGRFSTGSPHRMQLFTCSLPMGLIRLRSAERTQPET